ncbi:DNA internalization-related competence protein ComEC/Rec2 [Candidatus Izemoplasma sp. B36]|uniref:DNA internalization-related competence protein ComEC/Rec2 n=1 Tax=Candidatus Izemoplasma sp. B36 TaxID=3242468 RepID=UPI003558B80E
MNKLKNLLLYDASNYIHIVILVVLYYISRTTYIGWVLLVPEVVFLFKKSKNILVYALIIIALINIRIIVNERNSSRIDFPINGKVQEVYDDHFILRSNINYLCYYDHIEELKPGMIIEITGTYIDTDTYNIIHTFDYDLFLKSKNISQVVNVIESTTIKNTFSFYIIKYKINDYINNNFEQQTASFLKLFVLGDNELDDHLYQSTTKLGITHLFAVSGMHIAIIIGFLRNSLKRFNITKESSSYIIIIFLVFLNIITGFKVSIIRASCLVFGITINRRMNLILTRTDILAFIFIIFLLINPYSIYSLGFQLSFLISISIIMGDYLFKDDNQIKSLLKITLLATAISSPITLEVNNEIGLIFLLSNLFFILFVSYIFLPSSYFVIFIPKFSDVYAFIINIFIKATEVFLKINQVVEFNFPTIIHKLLFYFCIYMLIATYKNTKKMILYVILLIAICLGSLYLNYPTNRFVRFLDVFQGDAIHIHDNKCDMLIDTGDYDNYDNLIHYLKGNNTYEIDILLITHFHSDHYGELEDLINNLNIKKIYLNSDYQGITNYQVIDEGYCFECGTSKFQVLSANTSDENENNNSIVLYGLIGGNKYLFTGDIEAEVEREIVDKYNLSIDVLKVAHHGSNTSSIENFINETSGEIAIISVGKNNSYDLPNKNVLKLLETYDYQAFRTDESGSITIYYCEILDLSIIELYQKQKRNRYILWNV